MSRSVHVPLFDRLVAGPGPAADPGAPDLARLQQSIALDLSRLLNTRCGLTVERYLASAACVLDYGLPDLLNLPAATDPSQDTLAQVVGHAIRLYEPRLSDVQVRSAAQAGSAQAGARVTISASVQLGTEVRQVEFAYSPAAALLDAQEVD